MLALGFATAWLLAFVVLNQLQHIALPWTVETPTPPTTRIDPPGSQPPAAPRPRGTPNAAAGNSVFAYLAATVMATAVLMVASAILARRRRRGAPIPVRAADVIAAAAPGPEPLVVAAERGLAVVEDLSRGPREAIIACYVAMEQALVSAPGAAPHESDTPSEVLARAVANRALRADSAAGLVELFAEARFSTHTMTEGHREVAERALRTVLDELRGIP